jgi:tetratricopeptide (TPR) repeat protein
MQMGFVRVEQGRLVELVQTFESVAAQYSQLAAWRCALAYIYTQLERAALARDELEGLAAADFCDLPRDSDWLPSLSLLSEVVVFLDDIPRAQLLYDLLLPYAGRCVVFGGVLCQGSVSGPLGLLATTLSRYEEAARHFEHALTMNTQIKARLWIAHAQHDYARMLLLRNGPGDRDKARDLLGEVLAAAHRLGLRALADKAGPLTRTAGRPILSTGQARKCSLQEPETDQ